MTDAVLVDTNVFVYALDAGDETRHERALEAIAALGSRRTVVSTQVLSELASVIIHPRKLGMPPAAATAVVGDLASACDVLAVDPDTVIAALQACERWQLEYFDAQIWATAALNGVPVVLSEDFARGAMLGDVRFVDPFADEFALDAL